MISGVSLAPLGLLTLLNATENPDCNDFREKRTLASARLPQFGSVNKHHLDAEFQALALVMEHVVKTLVKVGEIEDPDQDSESSQAEFWSEELRSRVSGTVRIHVGQAPCISCLGAMKQFSDGFAKVELYVSFDT